MTAVEPCDPAPAAATSPAPRTVIVVGPRGAGKTRWMQDAVARLVAGPEAQRCAVVLAEEGRTRMENFVREHAGVTLHKFFPPCLCCPALIDLPGSLRRAVAANNAGWLFLELPAIAAPPLIPEFERTLGWPRAVLVCTGPRWAARTPLIPFQEGILSFADEVLADPAEADRVTGRVFARLPASA